MVMDDETLLRAFQKGDATAFDQLVLRHQDKVYGLCQWMLNDRQEAGDTAQDVFIKVFKGIKNFRFESSFSTWLYRIAVNTCKNRLRSLEYRFKKRFKRFNHPHSSDAANPSTNLADESLSPLAQLEKKERALLIRRAIDTLAEEKKSMIVLRDIQGFSYEEIAQITGTALGTVKSRLARARGELRKKLKGVI